MDLPQPRRLPRQRRSRALVDAILEATGQLLAEHGYAATNTNRVAERAGVSVGSVYQYFPNKEALVMALHERHALEVQAAITQALAAQAQQPLRLQLAAIVQGWLAVHRRAPALHRVLEQELPFLDVPAAQSPADQGIYRCLRDGLQTQQAALGVADLDLAAWMVQQTLTALVHAAVIPPGPPHATAAVEQAMVDMLGGYLAGAGVSGVAAATSTATASA